MMDDAATRELLGAYALDACDDDEVAAVEALIAHDLDARHEADRLREVASWLGATEALAPSAGLNSPSRGYTTQRPKPSRKRAGV